MVASENFYKGTKMKAIKNKEELAIALASVIPSHLTNDDIVFVCIGTDRSTGDSMAPFVGMYLEGLGYKNIVGTIDDPCNAVNLVDRLNDIPEGKKIIAIDACLGSLESVGTMFVSNGSIKAGAGVGKEHLPHVGDYSICGIVNIGGFMEYYVLANTRLSSVIKFAKDITSAICEVFPLDGSKPVKKKRNVKAQNKEKVLV